VQRQRICITRRFAISMLPLSLATRNEIYQRALTSMPRPKSTSSRSSSSTAKRDRTPRLETIGPKERRISTPRSDLLVVKIGRPKSKEAVSVREKASALVAGLVKATRKPGTSRERIFNSSVGKRVFAYSVYAGDTTKIVREDASGKRSVGRLVNGRFRSLPARTP
jgi:hypothetical protein